MQSLEGRVRTDQFLYSYNQTASFMHLYCREKINFNKLTKAETKQVTQSQFSKNIVLIFAILFYFHFSKTRATEYNICEDWDEHGSSKVAVWR